MGTSVFEGSLVIDKTPALRAIFETAGCLQFTPKNPVTLSSGIKSPIFFDLKLIKSADTWLKMIEVFAKIIPPRARIAGVYSGGMFHAPDIAALVGVEHIRVDPVRDSSGNGWPNIKYGKDQKNEEDKKYLKGANVVVVEDAVTTAGSLIRAVKNLRAGDVEAVVTKTVSILSYDFAETRRNLRKARITLKPLLTLDDVAKEMRRRNYISEGHYRLIKKWHSNPREFYR